MTPTNYQDLKYNELKKLAAERKLDSSGTKEDLIARLVEADGGAASSNDEKSKGEAGAGTDENQDSQSDENSEDNSTEENDDDETSKTAPSKKENVEAKAAKVEPHLQRRADQELKSDAQKMKEHLAKQRKVMIMIPFDPGVNPDQAKKIPFHLNLNGHAIDLPKGVYVEVPEQVAEIVKERLESEGKIGQQWRADLDARKQEALS